jgi:hypothetical protein
MANKPRYVMFASEEPKPMGDTLLEYAAPLLATLPPDHTFDELDATIEFAAVVWNIGIFDQVHDAIAYLARKMPPRLRLPAPVGAALVRRMLSRKELLFGDDDRAALAVEVNREGSQVRVKAFGITRRSEAPPPQSNAAPRDAAGKASKRGGLH